MNCWQDALQQTLNRLRRERSTAVRVALVGIGQEMRGDDAAGVAVARALQPLAHRRFLVLEGGNAPENITGVLRRFEPHLVVLVDAAQMDAAPGAVQWLPWQGVAGLSATTHTLPLTLLARYLAAQCGCEVVLLGIQPGQTELDGVLSPAVETAVADCAAVLRRTLAESLPFGATAEI